MYVRKTEDEYLIEYDYGYGDGKEVLFICSTMKEARETQRAYVENERIIPTIRKHRVKKTNVKE